MTTIQDNITRLQQAKADIKTAIENKGVTVEDNATIDTYAAKIDEIEQGGGNTSVVEKRDLNFYDYDGTRLYSYTWEEALTMTELPPLPTQKGLICQEWNYTLEEIKTQSNACDVGPTYITDDGKTRLYLTIENDIAKDIWLYLSGNIEVDWGDGTIESHNGSALTLNHLYTEIGDYMVSIEVKTGVLGFFSGKSYNIMGELLAPSYDRLSAIRKVEIGNGVSKINNYTFRNCSSLQNVIIPNSVTNIGNSSFYACTSLQNIVIPSSVTSIGSYTFQSCVSLQNVVISNNVTSIGTCAFLYCSSLQNVIIPSSVTSIETLFQYCSFLQSVIIPSSVTSIKTSSFQYCTSLRSMIIPNSVTNIGNYAFLSCSSLQNIVIPSSVTSIGNYAFHGVVSIAYIDFSLHTDIPTLATSTSIGDLNPNTKIIVPDNLYDEWIVATNWTVLENRIVKNSEYTRPL